MSNDSVPKKQRGGSRVGAGRPRSGRMPVRLIALETDQWRMLEVEAKAREIAVAALVREIVAARLEGLGKSRGL